MELGRLEKERDVRTEPEAAPEALLETPGHVENKVNFSRMDMWGLLGQVSFVEQIRGRFDHYLCQWHLATQFNLVVRFCKGQESSFANFVCSGFSRSRAAEFAWYLNLVVLRPNTLIPASIYGFVTTGCGILLSGPLGTYVDATPKLKLVRTAIVLQKIAATCVYAPFLAMFILRRDGPISNYIFWGCFAIVVVFGVLHKLSTTLLNVAVERDWVTCLADKDSDLLTKLNTHLRRIDLLCKLLSPLFVSLLTTAASYLVMLPCAIAHFQVGLKYPASLPTRFFWVWIWLE